MACCPSCGDDDAYVSVLAVECLNDRCAHFSPRWEQDFYAALDEESEEEPTNPGLRITDEELDRMRKAFMSRLGGLRIDD